MDWDEEKILTEKSLSYKRIIVAWEDAFLKSENRPPNKVKTAPS